MSVGEIITIVLASAGGSAVVVAGLGTWLGRVWADRILEGQRANNARDLELLKSQLELARTQERRNSDALFELYRDVWGRLADLQSVGDKLWEHASRKNLRVFIVALANARKATNRGRLILREEQYQQLQSAFHAFEEFQFGKRRLVELRSDAHFDEVFQDNSEPEVQRQIHRNGDAKTRYEQLIERILQQCRDQLGLPSNNAPDCVKTHEVF